MPALKKCHYEVLGVERNATDEDIKKSFRRLALQLHPDKNPERLDEAKEEFQLLQQAYEVLSNAQERAWYDEHRHAVLRGDADGEFDEDIIDILPFCSSSCYKGFGDDDEGFYTVYRKLFEKIAAEEYEAGLEDSDEEIPNFGDSKSGYEDNVGPFYAYWEAYCTHQSFGWVDEYNTRHAGNRRVARLMGKENKKFRSKAKQMWNQKVRALVDFVKRKDKRVQAWKVEQERILKEKEESTRRRQAEEKAARIRERQKLFEQLQSSKEKHIHENQDQLQQMESWMADEFGNGDEVLEDDDEYVMEYCHPCQKSFRTKQALINHEKSKKHLQQLQRWAEENNISDDDSDADDEEHDLQKESDGGEDKNHTKDVGEQGDEIVVDKESDIDDSEKTGRTVQGRVKLENGNHASKNKSDDSESDLDDNVDDLTVRFVTNVKFKVDVFDQDNDHQSSSSKSLKNTKRKGVKSKKQTVRQNEDDEDRGDSKITTSSDKNLQSKLLLEVEKEDDDFAVDRKKSGKDKKRRRANKSNVNSQINASAAATTVTTTTTTASLPTGNGVDAEEDKDAATQNTSKPHRCGKCGESFDSRSKLFQHISKTGHALPPDVIVVEKEKISSSKGSKKGKRKGVLS